jgi:hypothetical protein
MSTFVFCINVDISVVKVSCYCADDSYIGINTAMEIVAIEVCVSGVVLHSNGLSKETTGREPFAMTGWTIIKTWRDYSNKEQSRFKTFHMLTIRTKP